MKREINFRIGKGRITENKKALSPKALIDAMRLVGMNDDEIRAELKRMQEKSKP